MQRGWEWVDLFIPSLLPFLPPSVFLSPSLPSQFWAFAFYSFVLFFKHQTDIPMIFNFKVSFWSLGIRSQEWTSKGWETRLARAWSELVCTSHNFCHTWLVVLNFLGEKICSSITNKGAGIVVAVRLAARKDIYSRCEWLWAHYGSGYASFLKVPSVLEPNPALRGQTVVNDKAAGCGPSDGFGDSQPAGACSLADLNPQWKSRCPSPTFLQGCDGFLAFPWVVFFVMVLMDHSLTTVHVLYATWSRLCSDLWHQNTMCGSWIQLPHFSLNSGQIFRFDLQKEPKSGDGLSILAHISRISGEKWKRKFSQETTENAIFLFVYMIRYNMHLLTSECF